MGLDTVIQRNDEVTPTPVISRPSWSTIAAESCTSQTVLSSLRRIIRLRMVASSTTRPMVDRPIRP